jgi:hypothetical protein
VQAIYEHTVTLSRELSEIPDFGNYLRRQGFRVLLSENNESALDDVPESKDPELTCGLRHQVENFRKGTPPD